MTGQKNDVRCHMKLIMIVSFSILVVFHVHTVICITKAGQDRLFQTFGINFLLKIAKCIVSELASLYVQSV